MKGFVNKCKMLRCTLYVINQYKKILGRICDCLYERVFFFKTLRLFILLVGFPPSRKTSNKRATYETLFCWVVKRGNKSYNIFHVRISRRRVINMKMGIWETKSTFYLKRVCVCVCVCVCDKEGILQCVYERDRESVYMWVRVRAMQIKYVLYSNCEVCERRVKMSEVY